MFTNKSISFITITFILARAFCFHYFILFPFSIALGTPIVCKDVTTFANNNSIKKRIMNHHKMFIVYYAVKINMSMWFTTVVLIEKLTKRYVFEENKDVIFILLFTF